MAVSTRTRFEAFKRDDFKCCYCGRGTPDVVLEIDHIVPRCDSGTDELENLATACWECNRGKGAVPLEHIPGAIDITSRTELIKERGRQLRAFNEARRDENELLDAAFGEVWNYWFELWHTDHLEPWYMPWESALRRYVKVLPVEEIKESMRLAVERCGYTARATKYLGGVLRKKAAE